MAVGKPVKIAILADTRDAVQGFDKAGKAAKDTGSKFDSVADSSDQVASKSSQAAGALSGLGDLIGGKFGAAMQTGGIAMQAAADSGDLLNVVTESNIVRKIKDTAVTVAQTTATIAKTVADKVAAGAAKAWAAAQWLLNAAMTANPIGLVVLAIVALVAIFAIAWAKSDTFRKIVTGAFSKVKDAASAAFGWVKKNWPLLLAILTGPIGLAVLAIVKNWDKIKDGAGAVKTFVVERFNSLVTFIKGIPGKITGAASGMFNGIKNAFKSAINWIIDKWNGLSFTLPSIDTHIPGVGKVGGFTLSTPNIPRLASGGITTGPMMAWIGDNPGGREAVIPLDKYDLGGSTTYNITVVAPVGASSADIGRDLTKHIDAYERAGGRRRA